MYFSFNKINFINLEIKDIIMLLEIYFVAVQASFSSMLTSTIVTTTILTTTMVTSTMVTMVSSTKVINPVSHLNATLHDGQVDGGDVAESKSWVCLQPRLLRVAKP